MWLKMARYCCALVLLMFVLDVGKSSPTGNITIQPEFPVCLERGKSITLACVLHVNTSKAARNLTLLWYHNGLQLTNATTINHSNSTIVSRLEEKIPGVFTCDVQRGDSLPSVANSSVSVGIWPNSVTSLIETPKFISDDQGFYYVVVSWLNQGSKYEYSLIYTIDSDACLSISCPQGEFQPSCTQTHCTSRIYTEGFDLSKLCFYIVTRQGVCKAQSKVWKYNITLISCGVLPPQTLLFIPFSPTKLSIETSYRRVILRWEDILHWLPPAVLLNYTCSKTAHTTQLKAKNARVIVLSDKNIRNYAPYEICTFCLSIQEYSCGHFSEPLCKTTRLYEELPTEPPNITCSADSCPSTYDNQFRNLTVTWSLPPKKTWGGILREVKLYYRSANATWHEIVITDVLSTKYAILENLNKTLDYEVYLQACNREGCSSKSNDLLVSRIRLTGQKILKNNDSSSFNVWYIPVAAVVVCLVTSLFVICLRRRRSQPRPRLEEPLGERDNVYDIPRDENEYNVLIDNE